LRIAQLPAAKCRSMREYSLRDVAEEARPGDCGTFVPCQGAVFQHNIESEAPGQRGRQGTRPNEGTAHLDLPPMFAGSPDQVPCHIRANGADLAGLKNSPASGASWLRAGLPA
jgi:hypothetical protein